MQGGATHVVGSIHYSAFFDQLVHTTVSTYTNTTHHHDYSVTVLIGETEYWAFLEISVPLLLRITIFRSHTPWNSTSFLLRPDLLYLLEIKLNL